MNLKDKRKTISVSPEKLIDTELIQPGQSLPLVIKPAVDGIKLATWSASNHEWLGTKLLQYGGILFRNFNPRDPGAFEHFIQSISKELIEYSYRSTPRSQVSGKIYTSTEYPADQSIPLHNEMAYSRNWPMKIWFFCLEAAEQGGETPIADSRKVFQRIDSKIKEQFIQKKVMYVRNYGQGIDLEWENVFQTANKSEVESYCRSAGIKFEWKDGNHLRTSQVCQAIATHPKTNDMVWFNQAHLFHVSSLKSEVRESLLSAVKEEDLPRNVYYGDGSKIESSIIEEINEIYQQSAVTFSWQEGDILMLDNMLTAHGRKPFVGQRKVLVGMAEAYWSQEN
ncbi:MAG: TauD/TfdA family dioxygenase [Stigonema ocellatum SAG 48.90 = DSM 106950]|nr:TauD/TfdA family dioxygenase [Stigonema ocellatum SAG 48.90 = DSM 106950]